MGPLGEPLLLFPLTEDEEVKRFLAHPHFQSLSMKGDSNDGNQSAALCPAHQRVQPVEKGKNTRSSRVYSPKCEHEPKVSDELESALKKFCERLCTQARELRLHFYTKGKGSRARTANAGWWMGH